MCASRRRTKWILGIRNVQNDCRNMTDYVNRQVESSTPSDQQQRRPHGQKFDHDVAQKEGGRWLSEDAVDCQCLCRHAVSVRPSVRVSVTFMDSVKTNKHIFKIFFTLGYSHTIVFTYQTSWQYSDENPPNGASSARGISRNRDFQPISGCLHGVNASTAHWHYRCY